MPPARPQPAHAGFHWRIWGAEAAGTALLVLGALSAVAFVLGDGSPFAESPESLRLLVTGALVGATVSLIVISPLGRLSGAHLNPAVTLAFKVVGRVSGYDVAGYLVAQLTGALAGALAFRLLWGSVAFSVGGGVTHPGVATAWAIAWAIGIEAGMTGLLLAMIFLFVSSERLAPWTPLMLSPVIGALVWRGSPYTGTSLNPARSAGPAAAFTDFADLWLYVLAPVLGALAVAALWRRRHPSSQPKTAKLFHDPRYPCSLASELPALPPGDR